MERGGVLSQKLNLGIDKVHATTNYVMKEGKNIGTLVKILCHSPMHTIKDCYGRSRLQEVFFLYFQCKNIFCSHI